MKIPEKPKNEQNRLNAVFEYDLLDTLPEEDYDNITKLVANICNVPLTLITLLDCDRNFFKSHHGIDFSESPRDISFCGHAILSEDPIFIVEDARVDERFENNPLVLQAGAVFYAGVLLINPQGFALGTLCIFDHNPKVLTEAEKSALIILAKQVVNLMELRRQNIELQIAKGQLLQHNKELKDFASHVSHDLKSPLANIISLTGFLKEDLSGELSESSTQFLSYIEESSFILKEYIDGILKHYQANELLAENKEDVKLSELCGEIQQLLLTNNDTLEFEGHDLILNINKSALTQILINLVDNALKYNDKNQKKVSIQYFENLDNHNFLISDNGIGINQSEHENIFNLFATVTNEETKTSTGIGLNTVKNLAVKLKGDISVTSEVGVGSVFNLTIAK